MHYSAGQSFTWDPTGKMFVKSFPLELFKPFEKNVH
jgi:hypothetical protein